MLYCVVSSAKKVFVCACVLTRRGLQNFVFFEMVSAQVLSTVLYMEFSVLLAKILLLFAFLNLN